MVRGAQFLYLCHETETEKMVKEKMVKEEMKKKETQENEEKIKTMVIGTTMRIDCTLI